MLLVEYLNSQFSVMQNVDFVIRMVVACLCGACIGIERSKRFKEAGIRTHVIVCCAAALMMIVSKYGFADLTSEAVNFNGTRGADPARIAAQVVSGISFLGAGVIFKNGNNVKGLTTAAGIWATAGIGLAIGAGMYVVGISGVILIFLVQFIMHRVTVGVDSVSSNQVRFTVNNKPGFNQQLVDFTSGKGMKVVESNVVFTDEGEAVYDILFKSTSKAQLNDLEMFLEESEDVKNISFTYNV